MLKKLQNARNVFKSLQAITKPAGTRRTYKTVGFILRTFQFSFLTVLWCNSTVDLGGKIFQLVNVLNIAQNAVFVLEILKPDVIELKLL